MDYTGSYRNDSLRVHLISFAAHAFVATIGNGTVRLGHANFVSSGLRVVRRATCDLENQSYTFDERQ